MLFRSYARCRIIVNVTPLEPGWEGHVTLEFSNTTPLPAKIYANEGACQFLFLQVHERCDTSYRDRAGTYMGQRRVPLPRLCPRSGARFALPLPASRAWLARRGPPAATLCGTTN